MVMMLVTLVPQSSYGYEAIDSGVQVSMVKVVMLDFFKAFFHCYFGTETKNLKTLTTFRKTNTPGLC